MKPDVCVYQQNNIKGDKIGWICVHILSSSLWIERAMVFEVVRKAAAVAVAIAAAAWVIAQRTINDNCCVKYSSKWCASHDDCDARQDLLIFVNSAGSNSIQQQIPIFSD